MPRVGGVKYPYTPAGMAAARRAASKTRASRTGRRRPGAGAARPASRPTRRPRRAY